jgi:predicted O-linked N-acetylglucosamine transferase (SPINDLY family)
VEPQVLRAVCRGEAAAAGSHELAEAIDELERLAKAHPSSVETHQSLGGLLRLAGEPRRAVETLRAALLAFPRSTEIRVQLAAALRDLQETSEAIQVLRAAVLDAPRDLDLLNNLASVLRDERRYSDAMEILNVGIRVAPDHVPLRMNRASLWGRLHHPEAARADLAWVEHAAEEIAGEGPPSVSRELLQLRIACLNPGVFDDGQAMRGFRQALQQSVERLAGKVDLQAWIASGEVRYAPVPPMTLLDQPEENRSIRAAFAAVVGGVRTPERPADVRDGWIPTPASGPGTPPAVHASTPRPRVGFFVSPRHEGAFQRCMAGILRRLPTERFDLRVFGTPSSCQRLSHTFEGSSVQLAVVPARLDRMAETIRQAAVQLLFYWETGTDAWNYYLPFLRPASRQATSWGIPDTSGHPELDFYFSSRLVESPGVDRSSALAYSERLLLADTLLTYQVPPREPWVPENWRETLGLPAGKTVYLCSQNLAKVHPDFDGLLLEILRGDPRGVVVLFADREQTLADRLRRRLAGRSAELAERSLFLPHQPYEDYLRTLATADVLLDTVHCGGGLTAYDAFALGKPMVTWPGVHARARYVQACYQKMGWRNGVADSADAYVALALQWGKDPACRMQAEAEVRSLRGTLFEDPSAPSEFARLLDDALERPL